MEATTDIPPSDDTFRPHETTTKLLKAALHKFAQKKKERVTTAIQQRRASFHEERATSFAGISEESERANYRQCGQRPHRPLQGLSSRNASGKLRCMQFEQLLAQKVIDTET